MLPYLRNGTSKQQRRKRSHRNHKHLVVVGLGPAPGMPTMYPPKLEDRRRPFSRALGQQAMVSGRASACQRWRSTRAMSSDRASGWQGSTTGPAMKLPVCYSLRNLSSHDVRRGAAASRRPRQDTPHQQCTRAATEPQPHLADELLPPGGSPNFDAGAEISQRKCTLRFERIHRAAQHARQRCPTTCPPPPSRQSTRTARRSARPGTC